MDSVHVGNAVTADSFRIDAPEAADGGALAKASKVKVQVIEVGSGKVADIAGEAVLAVPGRTGAFRHGAGCVKDRCVREAPQDRKGGLRLLQGLASAAARWRPRWPTTPTTCWWWGTNDEDMALAANTLIESKGGMAVVQNGKVLGVVPLPIAGLMNDKPAEEMAAMVDHLTKCWGADRLYYGFALYDHGSDPACLPAGAAPDRQRAG